MKLLLKTAQNNGLQGGLTNLSVRKTRIQVFSIQTYLFPVNCAAQLSGHQNVKSLGSYKSTSIQHQRMSFTLSRLANVRQPSASSSFLTSFVDIHQKEPSKSVATKSDHLGIFNGAKFENSSLKS